MSRQYPAGPSYSDSPNASWHSHQNMPYDYPAPYDIYSGSATLSPSSDYVHSPFSFDEFDATTPLSPSTSASSSSSSGSDAPITPYYQARGGMPLPPVGMLFTPLDSTTGGREYCDSTIAESLYGYEGWEEDDATVGHRGTGIPESSPRAKHAQYDYSDALFAQTQYFNDSPGSGFPPEPPVYAPSGFATIASLAVSHPHAPDYSTVSCLSPAVLSLPPPLKLHQPQPRRSIPVVSLAALASGSENIPQLPSHFERPTSPTVSPLTLQFPSLQAQAGGSMTSSYSGVLPSPDGPPIAAYPSPCSCPECTEPYSIL